MADSTLWWLMTGAAVALELLTGTFYLLMLAIGLAAAAIAAGAGASMTAQLVTAAILGGGAVAAWRLKRGRRPDEPPAQANRDVNLDVGETVQVHEWNADGTATDQVPWRKLDRRCPRRRGARNRSAQGARSDGQPPCRRKNMRSP